MQLHIPREQPHVPECVPEVPELLVTQGFDRRRIDGAARGGKPGHLPHRLMGGAPRLPLGVLPRLMACTLLTLKSSFTTPSFPKLAQVFSLPSSLLDLSCLLEPPSQPLS